MQLSRWIGKHRQTVVLLLTGDFDGLESAGLLPMPLRFRFDFSWMVFFLHKPPLSCDQNRGLYRERITGKSLIPKLKIHQKMLSASDTLPRAPCLPSYLNRNKDRLITTLGNTNPFAPKKAIEAKLKIIFNELK